MWSVTDFIVFLFIYNINGTPLGERPQSEEPEPTQFIPAQWGKDSKLAYTWPKGQVPYFFDTKSYDGLIKSRVVKAIGALEADSCIRFKEQKTKPSKNSGSWLHFTNPLMKRDCFHEPSYKANGEIQVVLGYDCLKQRDITHAVMHGIGFRDEVAHPQRDLYVRIMWGNIQPAYRALFRIQPMEHAAGLLEYDPMSIMHFHDRAFSLNGQATVTTLLSGLKINPSNELSHLDKMKLRIMFGHECNKRKVGEVLDTCQDILSEDGPSPQDEKPKDNKENKTTVSPIDNEKDDSNEHKVDESNKEDKKPENVDSKQDVDETNKDDIKPEDVDPKEEVIGVGDEIDEHDSNKQDADGTNKDDIKPENIDPNEEVIVVGNEIDEHDSNKHDVDGTNKDDIKPENVDPKEEVIVVGDKIDEIDEHADKDKKNEDVNENVGSKEEIFIVGDNNPVANSNNRYEDEYDRPNKKLEGLENDNANEEFIIVGDKIHDDNENESPNANKEDKNNKKSEEIIIAGDNVKGGGVYNAKSNENDQENVDKDNAVVIIEETEDKGSNTKKLDKKKKAQQKILSDEGADEDNNSLKGNVVHNHNLESTD